MNAILSKGGSVNLTKESPTALKRLRVEAGWDVAEGKTVDLDLWGAAKDAKAVFYKNRQAVAGVSLSEDDRTGASSDGGADETMVVDAEALTVEKLAVFINIYEAVSKGQFLKDVKGAFVQFVNDETNEVLARLDLTAEGGDNFSILAGELTKTADGLEFKALADYSTKDAEAICAQYNSAIEVA